MPIVFPPCERQDCPGSDYPVSNFSSEKNDGVEFIAMTWPGNGPGTTGTNGGGRGPTGTPPLGIDPPDWPCVGIGESFVSQLSADLCSLAASQTCGDSTVSGDCAIPLWPTFVPGFVPVSPLFFNHAQTCSFPCPGGSTFTFSIKAGVIQAASQELADSIAHSLVCNYAAQHKVCITRPPARPGHPPYDPLHLVGNAGWCCEGSTLTGEAVFGVNGPGYTFSVSAGALPTGTTLVQDSDTTAALIGTLNVPGTYNFTITAQNQFGSRVDQSFTVNLIGLQNPVLPGGTTGVSYSQQIVAIGVVMPVTFTLLSPLPAGLSMSPSGLITGTPTTPTP
jgi:hypothetical protein